MGKKYHYFLLIYVSIIVSFFVITSTYAQTQDNEGHTQVCICHNVLHNPVTVCADDSSTIEQGHGMHLDIGFDAEGACPTTTNTPTPTQIPTNTPLPTQEPTSTPEPTNGEPPSTPTPTLISSPTATSYPHTTPKPLNACFQPRNIESTQQNAQNGLSVNIYNNNNLCAIQKLTTNNNTGNNVSSSNIGPSSIQTGVIMSSSNQSVSGNNNASRVTIMKSSGSNSTSIINSGNNVTINTTTQ